MEGRLAVIRKRLNQPLTLADKILFGHLDDPQNQPIEPGKATLFLRPDRVVLQDVLGQTAFLQLMQTGRERVAVPTTVHCDHLIQARENGKVDLMAALEGNHEVFDFLDMFAEMLTRMVINRFQLFADRPHTPRVKIDNVVVHRESWRFNPASEIYPLSQGFGLGPAG